MDDKSASDTIPNIAARRSQEIILLRAQVRFLQEMLIAKEQTIAELRRELQRPPKRAAY